MNTKLTNANIIRSVSDSQEQILQWIIDLYIPEGRFSLDPTYSKGNFYKESIPEPRLKSDIKPVVEGVKEADCTNLPLSDSKINSIIFDPPFVGGSRRDGLPGVIKTRFSYFENIKILWEFYEEAILEFYRVLKDNGVLVFKCQDTVESAKQYLSHVAVIRQGVSVGFYPKDLFILTAKSRILRPDQVQQHARKFHSYFLVFIKQKPKVDYP